MNDLVVDEGEVCQYGVVYTRAPSVVTLS